MYTSDTALQAIPDLGSGIGYRRELREAILASRDDIDFVEIVTEQFSRDSRQLDELWELTSSFTVIPHGVGLSVASPRLNDAYLRTIRRVSDICRSPYYSEHLAITRAPGFDIGHLAPVWYTEPVLANAIDNVSRVQDLLGKPLLVENISYLFEIPAATIPQAEFLSRLCDATGCGILLDLTNLYTNATNHRFDPLAFLDELPLERVVQLHLAGGFWADGVLIDGHCESVEPGSWTLLNALTRRIRVKASILEHDANFPADFSILVDQVRRARNTIRHIPNSATALDTL